MSLLICHQNFSPSGAKFDQYFFSGGIEIFPRKELNKSQFSLATQIPIFPGIVAEVGGSLSARAGIGLGITGAAATG